MKNIIARKCTCKVLGKAKNFQFFVIHSQKLQLKFVTEEGSRGIIGSIFFTKFFEIHSKQ